jgi:hypothetical protein
MVTMVAMSRPALFMMAGPWVLRRGSNVFPYRVSRCGVMGPLRGLWKRVKAQVRVSSDGHTRVHLL